MQACPPYLVLEHDQALVKVAGAVALAVHAPHQPHAVGALVAVQGGTSTQRLLFTCGVG